MLGEPIQPPLDWVPWAVTILATTLAAAIDVRTGRIPNLLTLPLLATGLAYAVAADQLAGLTQSLLGCVLAATPFVLLFVFAQGGAGDAKLMGAIGAWVGITNTVPVLIAVLISGAVLGIAYAVCRRQFSRVLLNILSSCTGAARIAVGHEPMSHASRAVPSSVEGLKMPYGVAICVGVTLVAIAKVLS